MNYVHAYTSNLSMTPLTFMQKQQENRGPQNVWYHTNVKTR